MGKEEEKGSQEGNAHISI